MSNDWVNIYADEGRVGEERGADASLHGKAASRSVFTIKKQPEVCGIRPVSICERWTASLNSGWGSRMFSIRTRPIVYRPDPSHSAVSQG